MEWIIRMAVPATSPRLRILDKDAGHSSFWASKDIDGFRCDMAEMVPVEFWEWAIPRVKEAYP